MNREIKFRAWLKKEKRIAKIQDLIFNGTVVVGFQESNNDQNADGKLHILRDCLKNNGDSITDIKINNLLGGYHFVMFELMQYTGLKDKNGVEIYEGDIVKCKVYAIDNETFEIDDIGEVVYDDDCCAYFIQFNEGYIHLTSAWNLEVIGNIYENPELLEVK